ncbi:MAG: GSCFA domain-containing protein [Pseudomonadota bacterium]
MKHPYENQPDIARWKRSVAAVAPENLDPLKTFSFKVSASDKVATAGSCFAQHIAKRLSASGYNYYVTEAGHPLASKETREKFQYGLYSARYGNLYTVRQLLQLFREAFGERQPTETVWSLDEKFVDPLRPNVEPGGFYSDEEVQLDRRQHLAAVREMFETLDVFVFTLGLTEAWESREDGTVFPLCPGVHGGVYDEGKYAFHNFDVFETVSDLKALLEGLFSVNSNAKVILTVSPVPLVATAEDRGVLISTTYSKSVLRVACDEMKRAFPEQVEYFPSYEIITGGYSRGAYFEEDLRSVKTEGVDHVMRVFFRHVTDESSEPAVPIPDAAEESFTQKLNSMNQLICEEEMLDAASGR